MWPIFLVHESIPFWKLRSRNHRRVGTSAARVALDRTIHRLRGGMMSLKLPYRWMTVHSMTKWWPNCSLLMFFCVIFWSMTSIETSTKLPHDILQPLPSESIDIFCHLTDRLSGWANRWQNWRYIMLPRAEEMQPAFVIHIFSSRCHPKNIPKSSPVKIPIEIPSAAASRFGFFCSNCGGSQWKVVFSSFQWPAKGWVEAELGHKVPTKKLACLSEKFQLFHSAKWCRDLLNLLLYMKNAANASRMERNRDH